MARTARAEQRLLAEMATGIGGSECGHLFDLPPYGCRRKLWYSKTCARPDFPRVRTKDMERGIELEPVVARLYTKATWRRLFHEPMHRHPTEEMLIVHPDRRIRLKAIDSGPGLLEIKCPNQFQFRKVKRDGLSAPWILQLQHGLLVTGWSWGAFAVFSAELWDLLHFDVPRDEQVIERIRQEGSRFWRLVENGPAPDRLFPDDPRCGTCEYRTQCQGEALIRRVEGEGDGEKPVALPRDDSLAPLVQEYLDAKGLADQADELVEGAKAKLEAAIGDRAGVQTDAGKVHYRPQERLTVDTKALREKRPEIAKEFERRSIIRSLKVYPS